MRTIRSIDCRTCTQTQHVNCGGTRRVLCVEEDMVEKHDEMEGNCSLTDCPGLPYHHPCRGVNRTQCYPYARILNITEEGRCIVDGIDAEGAHPNFVTHDQQDPVDLTTLALRVIIFTALIICIVWRDKEGEANPTKANHRGARPRQDPVETGPATPQTPLSRKSTTTARSDTSSKKATSASDESPMMETLDVPRGDIEPLAPRCHTCRNPLRDAAGDMTPSVFVGGFFYHQKCMGCRVCRAKLDGNAFRQLNDELLCLDCYQLSTHPACSGCGGILRERASWALGLMWHQGCFRCARCHLGMPANEWVNMNGVPFCENCAWMCTLEGSIPPKPKPTQAA
ncbi:unnamed protein product, partial [Mesorhabditis spiculigera]